MIPLKKRSTHVTIMLQPKTFARNGIKRNGIRVNENEEQCPVCECDPCDCHGSDDEEEEYWKIWGDK
tara:strand:- start:1504 stop:1704 length:201 start_codon:yes stop_codon:yes gene_type:complete